MTWQYIRPETGFLNQEQKAQVEFLFRHIMPSDSTRGIPGADLADAANYLDNLLAMDDTTYYELKIWRKLYRDGLEALNRAAERLFGKQLVFLSSEDCVSLLSDLERGALEGMPKSLNQRSLFRTLWRHCLQGCFCDPRWGGNRDKVMWKWYGYLQEPETINAV